MLLSRRTIIMFAVGLQGNHAARGASSEAHEALPKEV